MSLLGCSSGAEMTDPCAEPWSMVGGFDTLEEEAPPPAGGRSRFARFFTDEADDHSGEGMDTTPFTALGSLSLEAEPVKQHEDWQQGFRALLPNVNISFSAFD